MKRISFMTGAAFLALVLAASPRTWADDDWKAFVGAEKVQLLETVKTAQPTFYVSLEGNDAWSGRLAAPSADKTDGPFRTFEKARDAVREYRKGGAPDGKPTVVEVQPGLYTVEKKIEFTTADSGTADSPVIWRGVCGENGQPLAVLRGGKRITGGKKADDAAALARLQPKARDEVLQFDLRELGITDYGTLDGKNTAELFLNDRPMTIARYPNDGFMKFDGVSHEDNSEVDVRGTKGVVKPKLLLPGADLTLWEGEPDAWALGYWFWDWANGRQKIIRVDNEKKMIELDEPYHSYGYRPGQYFYVYHALCELDSPGEYYIDTESGKLYFYPPEEVTGENLYFSTLGTFVKGFGLEHIVFSGLQFEGCRDTALALVGTDLTVCGCLICNTGGMGLAAAGDRNLVFGNHLYSIGGAGISVSGGDRAKLLPAVTALVNNDVHHYGRIQRMYAAGIGMNGCGILIAQNRISDAPHCAILFGGNDIRIERNEICRVCEESNDAGAIYIGRNWTMRGNVVKQNYLHDISGFEGRGCVGVYLDDMLSSVDILDNLFVNVTCAVMIGGGRDNNVLNNLFINCRPNLHVDARALGWCHNHADGWMREFKEKGTLSGIDILSELWKGRYPALAKIMEGNPYAPEGNVIERNLVISTQDGNTEPAEFSGDQVEQKAREFITLRDNVQGDARLLIEMTRGESAVLPGTDKPFNRIPVEAIGLFQNDAAIAR
ncbi:MAG: right-handed parallel beta-helix repeat-containing protein [Thermoguttaceae bacterium]|nr:right-handed parallel beta-helix repeat-containing protein [Thermoguttaceae bacterium]